MEYFTPGTEDLAQSGHKRTSDHQAVVLFIPFHMRLLASAPKTDKHFDNPTFSETDQSTGNMLLKALLLSTFLMRTSLAVPVTTEEPDYATVVACMSEKSPNCYGFRLEDVEGKCYKMADPKNYGDKGSYFHISLSSPLALRTLLTYRVHDSSMNELYVKV